MKYSTRQNSYNNGISKHDSTIENIFLVEHDYEVPYFQATKMEGDIEWIAVGPSAMHCLGEAGIPYSIPDNYYSREETYRKCCEKFDKLKIICEGLDACIIAMDPFLAEYNIRPFAFHLWQLAYLIDILTYRSMVLDRILSSHCNSKIYYKAVQPQPWGISGIGFHEAENIWGRLLSLPSPHWSTNAHALNESNQDKKAAFDFQGKIKKIARLVLSHNMDMQFAFAARKRSVSIRTIVKNLFNRSDSILVLNNPRDWDHLIGNSLFSRDIIYFLQSSIYSMEEKFSPDFKSDGFGRYCYNEISKLNAGEPIDVFPLIADRIFWIAEAAPRRAKTLASKMKDIIVRKKPKALLNAISSDFASHVFMATTMKLGVPVLKWQHGSIWFKDRIIQRVDLEDLMATDTLLVYGGKVKDAYEKSSFVGDTKIVSVGSLTLAVLRKECNVNHDNSFGSKRLLYVSTATYGNKWYCSFAPPFMDTLYIKDQIKIINGLDSLMERFPDTKLTIKLPVTTDVSATPSWLEKITLRQNVAIVSSGTTFKQLLVSHDAVIIDCPTTTLLEALCTHKALFILVNSVAWPDEALVLLRRRAVCTADASELVLHLSDFLKNRLYPCDYEDDSFLRDYGVENSVDEILLRAGALFQHSK